jgi:shikimate kinase
MRELEHRFVAEIIGPAGAGKTSLSRLLQQSEDIRSGLSVWRLPGWLLAVSAFLSIPKLLTLYCLHRCLGWGEVKLVIQLNALRLLLHLESAKGFPTLLMDEGMIFALSKLDECGRERSTSHSQDKVLHFLNPTTKILDAVIWLDAPDEVLAQRIRERAKPHRIKHQSDADIQEHLDSCRKSFEKIVAELNRSNDLKVIRFSTDKEPLEQIAAQILSHARLRNIEAVKVATSIAGV